MSKIQDALRRIRESSTGSRDLGPVVDMKETTALATVTNKILDEDDGGNGISSPVICVDRAILRKEGFLAPEDQEREFADQYRVVKRPLLNNGIGAGSVGSLHSNLLMIASALPGDGKTFTCINLALSMSIEKDSSVLLVDADVAKPHISHLFAVENEAGLTDVLMNDELNSVDVIIKTDVPGLSIMPAGRKNEYSTELLASKRMARLLASLATADPNRIVLFDSPPLLSASEASVLASGMGQIAMIVRANHTPQQAVLDAIASLDLTKPVNIILNQVGEHGQTSGYGQSAYSQYGYPSHA